MPIEPIHRMGGDISWVKRCPHCGIAAPNLSLVWASQEPLPRSDGKPRSRWSAHRCTTCGSLVTFKGSSAEIVANPLIVEMFPEPKAAHADIPSIARNFLQQAYETLHAPDAAAVMAGSAVDAMLKEKGYVEGSLYARIDQALADHVLTEDMAEWAHRVRLGSNRPRHADKDSPHVSSGEARQSVDFAEALGSFLFVLSERVRKGIAAVGGEATV